MLGRDAQATNNYVAATTCVGFAGMIKGAICTEPTGSLCAIGDDTSSVHTLNCSSLFMPNEVDSATSVASRPRAISTRECAARCAGHPACTTARRDKLQATPKNPSATGSRERRCRRDILSRRRGNVHRTQERNRQMLKIPAHAPPIVVDIHRRLGRAGIFVSELDVGMHPLHHRPHALPRQRRLAEQIPRRLRQAIDLAIPARQQKRQRFIGQFIDRMKPCPSIAGSGRPESCTVLS